MKSTVRKVFVLLLAGTMLLLAACGGGAGSSAPASAAPSEAASAAASSEASAPQESTGDGDLPTVKVAYLNRLASNEFLKYLEDTIVAKMEEDPTIEVVAVYDANNDSMKQMQQFEDAFTLDVDIILGSVNDSEALLDSIYQCNEKGIPFIAVSTELNQGPEFIQVGVSNYDCGYEEGVYIAENLKENGTLLYLAGNEGMSITTERREGLFAALEESGRDDIELLSDMSGDYTAAMGMRIMEDWLQVYPEFDCLATVNDQSMIGAIQALQAAGHPIEDAVLVSIDAETVAKEYVKENAIDMTVMQDADGQAEKCYEVVKMLRRGETPDARYDIPLVPITVENVDEHM